MARRTSIKGKLVLLGAMLGLFAIFVVVTNLLKDNAHQVGQLRITSSPSTNVFVDNVNVGKTPFEKNIEAGEYAIKLIPDRTATSTASWEGKVTVYKNARSYINRELGASNVLSSGETFVIPPSSKKSKKDTGEVFIETEPIGALVYLNGEERGIAPLTMENVPVGSHELSLFIPGFVRRTTKINVEHRRSLRGIVKLALDEAAAQAKKQASISAAKRASASAQLEKEQEEATGSAQTSTGGGVVIITGTPLGWLRVRSEPNLTADEVARVNEGERYSVLESVGGWVRIPYSVDEQGWVSAQFTQVEE